MTRQSTISIADISSSLAPLFSTLGIDKAILFGSHARGTATRRSDIDLIIVKDTEKRFFERYDDFVNLDGILKGYHVDALIYTPAELKAISHRRFIKEALQDGVVIYEH